MIMQYLIIFDSRGGSPVPYQYVWCGCRIAEPVPPVNTLIYPPLRFIGWYTEEQGCGAVKWDFRCAPTSDMVLYAHWEAVPVPPLPPVPPVPPVPPDPFGTFTVTFDCDGGEPSAQTQNIPYGQYVARPADPVKEGYTFEGWFEYESGLWYNFDVPVTGDLNLVAAWRAI
ncbi:MAG: InlB B-repeat-containing protein [Ruminococcus sp.]|jgi:uncharacterized repeat protein (TIGR02543 family)|nr:InlB B-repeat-containing protein [Ruminococcus sp.]